MPPGDPGWPGARAARAPGAPGASRARGVVPAVRAARAIRPRGGADRAGCRGRARRVPRARHRSGHRPGGPRDHGLRESACSTTRTRTSRITPRSRTRPASATCGRRARSRAEPMGDGPASADAADRPQQAAPWETGPHPRTRRPARSRLPRGRPARTRECPPTGPQPATGPWDTGGAGQPPDDAEGPGWDETAGWDEAPGWDETPDWRDDPPAAGRARAPGGTALAPRAPPRSPGTPGRRRGADNQPGTDGGS